MKLLPVCLVGSAILTQTDAVRKGRLRKPMRYLPFDQMPQGDDPFSSYTSTSILDYSSNTPADSAKSVTSRDEIVPLEVPYCPPHETCTATMREEDCTCDCNEEPPPKCNLDVVVMIDVCSCSKEVWHGIKSYVNALLTKYEHEIGISKEEINVAIVAFADNVDTIVSFGEPASWDFKRLTDDISGIVTNINIQPFASQGTYIDKALKHVRGEFDKARPESKKVLVTLTDGYNHPSVNLDDFRANVDSIVNMGVSVHAIARLPYTRNDDCGNFSSSNRRRVCVNRADVLRRLNGGDESIFVYSDARSTHDVIQASDNMCPAPPEKALHCECTCSLPRGCPGKPGPNGMKGEGGAVGAEGRTGADGKQGLQGVDGPQGPVGDKGPNGSPGVNGPRGEPGRNGDHGSHGYRGEQGDRGTEGLKGVTGPSGESGDTGTQGLQGDQGSKGIAGMPGPAGPRGKSRSVDMGALKRAVFAILDELKPGGQPLPQDAIERILMNGGSRH